MFQSRIQFIQSSKAWKNQTVCSFTKSIYRANGYVHRTRTKHVFGLSWALRLQKTEIFKLNHLSSIHWIEIAPVETVRPINQVWLFLTCLVEAHMTTCV